MYAIVFTISNSYIPALKVLLATIRKNISIEVDFIAIEEEKILDSNKKIFENVTFIQPGETPLQNCDGRRGWLINPSTRFNIFKLKKYKKILFLDVDMLCLSNIDEIFNYDCDFGAVYHPYPDGYGSMILNKYKTYDYSKSFNAGLMLIGEKYLNDTSFNELIQICKNESWLGNQGPLNLYFNDKVTLLPESYFVTTPLIKSKDFNNVKFLHFGGSKKPWLTTSMDMKENYSDFVLKNVGINMGPIGHIILMKLLYKYKMELKKYNDICI